MKRGRSRKTKVQIAVLSCLAGFTDEVSFLRSLARARKSHSTWRPCQKSSDPPSPRLRRTGWPKKAPKRIDMAGVTRDLEGFGSGGEGIMEVIQQIGAG